MFTKITQAMFAGKTSKDQPERDMEKNEKSKFSADAKLRREAWKKRNSLL